MKGYLAGPMRGIDKWNFPAFDANAKWLRKMNYEVISPAEMDRDIGFNENDNSFVVTKKFFEEAMRRDYAALTKCEAIFLMPHWEDSTGANLEVDFAKILGLKIFLVDETKCIFRQFTPTAKAPDIKDLKATEYKTPFMYVVEEIVAMHNKKQKDYGSNTDPFANVRAAADFGIEPWIGCLIRANDKMKRLQKAASGGQLANESVEDSMLDLAVYAIICLVLYREGHPAPVTHYSG